MKIIYNFLESFSHKIFVINFRDKFSFRDIKSVKHRETHILILTNKGEVYDHKLHPRPLMINIKKIICKYNYSLALTKNNEIYNVYKTIPMISGGVISSEIKKISCSNNHIMILTKIGKLYGWGGIYKPGLNCSYFSTTVQELMDSNVMLVDCGQYHTIVVTLCGKIYVWGSNSSGQLGLGDFHKRYLPCKLILPGEEENKQNILSVKCGALHTMMLMSNNHIYVWGSNFSGQLGLFDDRSCCVPQKISLSFLDGIIQKIHCGGYFTIVMTQTKTYGTGANTDKQLRLDHAVNYYGLIELPSIIIPKKIEI